MSLFLFSRNIAQHLQAHNCMNVNFPRRSLHLPERRSPSNIWDSCKQPQLLDLHPNPSFLSPPPFSHPHRCHHPPPIARPRACALATMCCVAGAPPPQEKNVGKIEKYWFNIFKMKIQHFQNEGSTFEMLAQYFQNVISIFFPGKCWMDHKLDLHELYRWVASPSSTRSRCIGAPSLRLWPHYSTLDAHAFQDQTLNLKMSIT